VAIGSRELEAQADELLANDLRSELCRHCDRRGVALGDPETLIVLDRDDEPTGLAAVVARYVCEAGHVWHAGEGKPRGRGGEAPILLEDHYAHRRSKEAYMAEGVVNDFVKPGMFHRDHVDK
jgi:hypothetical protein